VVNETLKELNANDKPTLLLFNKIDAFSYIQKEADDLTPETAANLSLAQLEKSWMSKLSAPCLFISATKKENVDELRKVMYNMVSELHQQRYPHNKLLY
jgi:GTP-binding protein HflX